VFNALTDRLSQVMKKMRGWGSLNERNIRDGLREIRLALLEADVNYKVVKDLHRRRDEDALGEQVMKSVTPAQQFTKVVYDRLVQALGSEWQDLDIRGGGISTLMLVGLQGSGKTTTAVKLAHYVLKNFNKKPLLVAADVYRPAAVRQLELLAEKNGFDVFTGDGKEPLAICRGGTAHARDNSFGAVIIDTAGRLELDERMMGELERSKKTSPRRRCSSSRTRRRARPLSPSPRVQRKIGFDGKSFLSRMDSDARAGAAPLHGEHTGEKHQIHRTGGKSHRFRQVLSPESQADPQHGRRGLSVEKVRETWTWEKRPKNSSKRR